MQFGIRRGYKMVLRMILVLATVSFFITAILQLFDGKVWDAFENGLLVIVCLGETWAFSSPKKTPEQTSG
jgi:hypothetical protein